MRLLSTQSLLALIWASATLATPFLGEPISSSDLAIRGAGTAKCPSTYESKNGLNFTTYCEQNNPGNDADVLSDIGSMEECMERCSRYWGDGEGCFGIVWREDNKCWIRNSSTSDTTLTSDSGIHSALIQYGAMNALSDDCPFDDTSSQTLAVNGTDLGYTVHCDKSIQDYDECWQGYPECLQTPFIGFYHATSLVDCLQICVREHPLCQAVVYNPGLNIGFANCWPKSGYPDQLQTPGTSMGTIHTATINSLDHIDTKCPSSSTYTASSGSQTTYEVHCGKVNNGVNITSLHLTNVTACIEACASISSTQNCTGVVFDSSMQGGYENCYLQNTTGVVNDQAQTTYAIVAGSGLSTEGPASSSRSGTGSDVEGGKGKSKAWIAGPVIGVVAGLALVGAALFFWRRRKASVSASAAKRGLDATDDHDKPPAGVATAPPPHALQHQDTALSYGAAPAYTPFTPVEQNQNQNQNQVKAGGPGAFSYAQVQQHGPVEMHGETEIFEVPDTGFINGEKGARGGVHEM